MTKLRLSKSSLQQQRGQLKLYERLLPSLDLKRRQLMIEAHKTSAAHQVAIAAAEQLDARIGGELPMLALKGLESTEWVTMTGYRLGEQNVVGVRLPYLEHVEFAVANYSQLTTPAWVDILVRRLKEAAEARVQARVAGERARILEQAVRRITQRVNLFEKVLIPTVKDNIHRINIYLGDAERTAVVTSKLAKAKQQAVTYDSAKGTL